MPQAPMGRASSNMSATPLPFRPPREEDQLVAWLNAKREAGRPAINDAQLKLNLAFMLGYQWVTWDERVRNYRRVTVDASDRNAPVRVKSNKIGAHSERLVAKLTKSVPEPELRPVSDNDNDVDAARVGTRILGSELNRLKWDSWLAKFLFWPVTHGWAYAYVYWDPDDGPQVAEVAEATEDDSDDDVLFMGNTKMEMVAADELSVDPSAIDMENARWAVRTSVITREEAWVRWDVELEGGAQRTLAQAVHSLGGTDAQPPSDEWVEVHQLWLRPGKAAPKGMVATWSQNKIIEVKEYPYDHGKLPFVQCNWLPGIGTREGRTWVTDTLDLQTDYNDSLSRTATFRRQLSPKFIAATGQVDPQRITSRVEVLTYTPGITATPPHYEAPNAAWAQQFNEGMERSAADLGERAGINDATAGQAASTAPAASIMALQEADDTKLALTAKELAAFISGVGEQLLALSRQFWAEERTVRVWSDEDILSAYRYIGADIDEQLDVHVSAESALPKSKAAMAQLVLELAARYPDDFKVQDVVRMLDVPGVDFMTRSIDVDTRKQWREIGQMLEGDDCQVQPFDNHVVHLQALNSFRKSIDYENLPVEGKARFDAHAAVHEELVLKQLGMSVPVPNPTQDPTAMQQSQTATAGVAATAAPPQQPGAQQQPMPQAQGGAAMGDQAIAQQAGIGQAAGQPGRVPGMPVDNLASRLGR